MKPNKQQNSNNKTPELHYLLLLLHTTNLVFSVGIRLFTLLSNIAELFSSDIDLSQLGLSAEIIAKIKKPNWQVIEQDLCWQQQAGHHIITLNDDVYPDLLREIQNPPLLLFVIGNLQLLKSAQLAIVGSRNPTPVGVETAFGFSQVLADAGLVITSGLASGIDAASHRGALASSTGKTIAVMGTGLNQIYPARHKSLAEKIIAAGGVLLSEFPLYAKGKAWHFPYRNRIISGLSLGTLVVEAAIKSGSLITAKFAGEQGREVFALPGSIYNPVARGCHYLIQHGAKLVEQPTDILEEFPEFATPKPAKNGGVKGEGEKNKLDCVHEKLLDCVSFEVTPLDILAARVNLPVSQVGGMLVELELRGLVKRMAGGYIKGSFES